MGAASYWRQAISPAFWFLAPPLRLLGGGGQPVNSPLHTTPPSSLWSDNTRKPHYFTSCWSALLDNFISLCFSLKQLYGVCLGILLWLKVLYCYCLYKASETGFPKEFRVREEIVFLSTSPALFIRFVKLRGQSLLRGQPGDLVKQPKSGFQQRCCTSDFLEKSICIFSISDS